MNMEIKVFGPGCQKCKVLTQRVSEVISEESFQATLVKVEDYEQILASGVTATPALSINDVLLVSGRVPTKSAIKQLIIEHN